MMETNTLKHLNRQVYFLQDGVIINVIFWTFSLVSCFSKINI